MIIVLKQDAPDVQVREFCHELEGMGLQINDSKGSDTHILGLIGDTKAIAESWPNSLDDTCAREEWGWKPEWDLSSMTDDMLEVIRKKNLK